jgi:hypothetical protein
MNRQVKRWAKAAAAMTAGLLAVNAATLGNWWYQSRNPMPGLSPQSLWDVAHDWVGQALVCLLIYVLAEQAGRRLLRGRFAFTVATVIFLVAAGVYEWRGFAGVGVGYLSFLFGWQQIVDGLALPFAAGAWVLWSRAPKPDRDTVSSEIPGVWDAPNGVLTFDPDGIFTLALADGSTTAGLWERLPGELPQIVLKVVSVTQLGYGWQATVLGLDAGPHGAVLRGTTEYRRREAETVLERSSGYIGAVEVLEG